MNISDKSNFINLLFATIILGSLMMIICIDFNKTNNVIKAYRSSFIQTTSNDISISLPYNLIPTNQKFFIEVHTDGALSSLNGKVNNPNILIDKRKEFKVEGESFQYSGELQCEIPNDSSLIGKEIKIDITAFYYMLKEEGSKSSGYRTTHFFSKQNFEMKEFTIKANLIDFEKYNKIGNLNFHYIMIITIILFLISSFVILFVRIKMRISFTITYFSSLVICYSYIKLKVFLLGITVSLQSYGGIFMAVAAPLLILLLIYLVFGIIAISQRSFSTYFHKFNEENFLRDED